MDLHYYLWAILRCLGESMDWKKLLKQAIDKVLEFLKSAFWLIRGLPRSIKKVEEHLLKIYNYLEENEALANDDENVKTTLKKIIPIKHCLEDAIDRYDLLLQQRDELRDDEIRLSNGFLMKLKKGFQLGVLYVKQVIPLYFIASTVAQMETALQEALLGNSNDINQPTQDEAEQSNEFDYADKWTGLPFTEEYYLVGLEGPKQSIIELLDLEMRSSKTENRFLVAVVGEGGVGKTTVVKEVYEQARSEFELSASVTVSRTYDKKAIFMQILKQFGAPDEILGPLMDLQVANIIKTFEECFQISNKRFIVVLDDVWDNGLLDDMQKALTCAGKGSRILLTTRLEVQVARPWCRSFVGNTHKCQPMSEDDALVLLCRKVFKTDGCCNTTEGSLREILQRCPLLPLIISAVGGLLAEDGSNWNAVSENLGLELRGVEGTYERTKKILLHSYYHLPYEIRSCFLYFGMFPEDHEIEVGELIRMWIAEGFVKKYSRHTLEDVAKMYMKQLVQRGLVMTTNFSQDTSVFPSVSEFTFQKLAKVHDILHVITRDKIEELDFGQVLTDDSSSYSRFRRLALIDVSDTLDLDPTYRVSRNFCSFRSIMLNHCESFPNYLLSLPPEVTNCLRVIHLEASEIADKFPDEIKNLHNLRFLKLSLRNIQVVPEFIGQLLILETLEITVTTIDGNTKLPQELKRLKKLRHLILSPEVHIPVGVLESLIKLQTLEINLEVSESADLIGELQLLNHLITLRVANLKHDDVRAFFEALKNKNKLQSLGVWHRSYNTENTAIDSETESWILFPPKNLKELALSANLGERLPRWFQNLDHLVCLSFDFRSDMKEDPLQVLKHLPCLEVLWMRIDHCASLNFGTEKDFTKLRLVAILATEQLQSISGFLPSLQRLHLQGDVVDIEERIRENTIYCDASTMLVLTTAITLIILSKLKCFSVSEEEENEKMKKTVKEDSEDELFVPSSSSIVEEL